MTNLTAEQISRERKPWHRFYHSFYKLNGRTPTGMEAWLAAKSDSAGDVKELVDAAVALRQWLSPSMRLSDGALKQLEIATMNLDAALAKHGVQP